MSREERVKNKFVGAHVSTCDHKGTFSDKTKNKFLGPHVSTCVFICMFLFSSIFEHSL